MVKELPAVDGAVWFEFGGSPGKAGLSGVGASSATRSRWRLRVRLAGPRARQTRLKSVGHAGKHIRVLAEFPQRYAVMFPQRFGQRQCEQDPI